MASTKNHQSGQHGFATHTNPPKHQKTHGDVRQDKGASRPRRTASGQPAAVTKSTRARQLGSNGTRSQTASTHEEKAVKVTVWIKPRVKAELERIAAQDGVSLSATCAALLEKAIRQELHLQYAALLQPMVQQAIAREMRTISTRLAWLLVRVAFDAGQTRSMVTNILGRQPGVTPEILKAILTGSGKTAKSNITRRTPQIVELIEAVEKWIIEGNETEEEASKRSN